MLEIPLFLSCFKKELPLDSEKVNNLFFEGTSNDSVENWSSWQFVGKQEGKKMTVNKSERMGIIDNAYIIFTDKRK